MKESVQVELVCQNENCPNYAKSQSEKQHNLQKFGFTAKGCQRYICSTCRQTFSEPYDYDALLFGKRRTAPETILNMLVKASIDGISLFRLTKLTGHKEDAIRSWAYEVASYRVSEEMVERINSHLRERNGLSEEELKIFWAFIEAKEQNRRR